MKKTLFAAGLILLIGIVLAVYFGTRSAEKVAPADLLPADTFVYCEIKELKKDLLKLSSSRLGQNLSTLDIPQIMRDLDAPKKEISQAERLLDKNKLQTWENILYEIFGQQVCLALLPVHLEKETSPDKARRRLLSSLVIFSLPEKDARLIQLLSNLIPGLNQENAEQFKNHQIKRIVLSRDLSIFHTVLGELLIMSFDYHSLTSIIQMHLGQTPSLNQEQRFQKANSDLQEKDRKSFLYVDGLKAKDLIGPALQKMKQDPAFENSYNLKNLVQYIQAWESLTVAGYAPQSHLHENIIKLKMDLDSLDAGISELLAVEPTTPELLDLISPSVNYLNWQNNFDLRYILQSNTQNSTQMAAVENFVQDNLNLKLQDLYQALSGELGVSLYQVETQGMIPVPHLSVYIGIQSQDTMERGIEYMLQNLNATGNALFNLQTEKFKEHKIQSLLVPLMQKIQPSWSFVHNYLVLTMHPETIREMLRIKDKNDSVLQDKIFQEVDKGLSAANNSINYLRVDRLADISWRLAKWFEQMAAQRSKTPGQKEKARIIMDRVVQPVLNGMKYFQALSIRSYVQKDAVIIKSYLKTEE